MLVYTATSAEFAAHVRDNRIDTEILAAMPGRVSPAEVASWRNSLNFMKNALEGAAIPPDAGVAIEYRIPLSAKRVDFILSGTDDAGQDTAVVVELKQWESAEPTDKDGIVVSVVGGAPRELVHPSYQAWTYTALIEDYNEAAHDGAIRLRPCAYLHNFLSDQPLKDARYADHTNRAPVFVKHDAGALQDFLARYIRRGDRGRLLYELESGRLRPSKNLADHLSALLQGNRAFEMIDDQKLVYESALAAAARAETDGKQVLLVEGGPGTGKSVVAINLLVELTNRRLVTQYVTRNAAPRAVFKKELTGTITRTRFDNLFKNSGAYVDAPENGIDVLVVDEAHRLTEKSGLYGNLGSNQIMELIAAARCAVFFVDDNQRVTLKDIGEAKVIEGLARAAGATVERLELASQFRCNGSDGYLAWLDHVLQVRETAQDSLDGTGYHFRVFDSPVELHDAIRERNAPGRHSRVVAGYCWDWEGKKDPSIEDVVIQEHGYSARWNLTKDGGLWIASPDSVDEVGCIHTCQGLELDTVGVIIGLDLVVRDGVVVTDAEQRSRQDSSIKGYKKWLKEDPEGARAAAERVIKNTYRTLMTRGQKGCYVYAVDQETREFLRNAAASEADGRALMPMAAEPRPHARDGEATDR